MLGILLKERLVIAHKHKKIRYLIDVITIIAFMFILEGQGAIVLPYILVPLEVLSVIVTLAANDEESKWNRFAIALPVKKQDIVKARFGYITIILLIGTAITFGINLLGYFIFHDFKLMLHIAATLGVLLLTLFLLSILLMTSYLSGANATFIALTAFIIILLVITFITDRLKINLAGIIADNFSIAILGTIIFVALFYFFAFKVSVWAFSKNCDR